MSGDPETRALLQRLYGRPTLSPTRPAYLARVAARTAGAAAALRPAAPTALPAAVRDAHRAVDARLQRARAAAAAAAAATQQAAAAEAPRGGRRHVDAKGAREAAAPSQPPARPGRNQELEKSRLQLAFAYTGGTGAPWATSSVTGTSVPLALVKAQR